MLRYVVRRLLYMIPTVLGVILVTFVLFNVVGGSPASMTLGKNVSARMLEEFDEQRGFNKPLIAGLWTGTRAYEEDRAAAAWKTVPQARTGEGVKPPTGVVLPGPGEYAVPLAFPLRPDTTYRWRGRVRASGAGASWSVSGAGGGEIPPGVGWTDLDVSQRTGPDPVATGLVFSVASGDLEIARLALARRVRHPFDSQFFHYLGSLVRLDFGVSTATNQKVSSMLRAGILPSLVLTVPVFFGDLFISILAALVCAFFRNTWIDRFFVVASVVLMSVPYLVWIVAGQYVLAFRLGAFPIWGFESWRFLLLPWIIGIFSGLGTSVRFYRTVMLDEMYRDYVRTAFAKGVGAGGVLFKHVLKNAMIPIVTNVVMAIPFLYTGSLLLESFFGIPGLGYMAVNAVNSSDVDVVRAVVFIGAVLYVVANLVTDICYALVDPRVRFE